MHPPFPKHVALSQCAVCGDLDFARHVNREDDIPKVPCPKCGGELALALYGCERPLQAKKQ